MGTLQNPTKIGLDRKLKWIEDHPELFRITDESYEHPYPNVIAHTMASMLRHDFGYSAGTNTCDLVYSWLSLYRAKVKPKIKSMKDFNHGALAQRIQDILSNDAHKDHHDMLMEMFPEIYDKMRQDHWNEHYEIGHVYVRLTQDGDVTSLLMPVKVPIKLTYEDPDNPDKYGMSVRMLNLITGSFWQNAIRIGGQDNRIEADAWKDLIGGKDPQQFIHLGAFGHGVTTAYLVDIYREKIYLYDIEEDTVR